MAFEDMSRILYENSPCFSCSNLWNYNLSVKRRRKAVKHVLSKTLFLAIYDRGKENV